MKKISKFLALATVMIAFTAATFAQSATATAVANVITPIAITHNTGVDPELNFGNIVGTTAGGSVTVSAEATAARSSATPELISNNAVTVTAAKFTVTGNPAATYAITLPVNGTTNLSDGTHNMAVNFTSSPTTSGTLTGGTQDLYVGGTLTVGANQTAGSYSTTFSVTVSYN